MQNTVTNAVVPAISVNGAGNALTIGGASLSSATSAGLTFSGNGNVIINGTVANGIQASGNINCQGVTMTLTGTNAYSGTTVVSSFGALKLGSAHALGSSSSVSVTSSSKFDLKRLDTRFGPSPLPAPRAWRQSHQQQRNRGRLCGDMNTAGLTTMDGVGNIMLTGTVAGTVGLAMTKNGNNSLTFGGTTADTALS